MLIYPKKCYSLRMNLGFLKLPEILLNVGVLSSMDKDSSQDDKEKWY